MKSQIGSLLVMSIGLTGLVCCAWACITGEADGILYAMAIISMLVALGGVLCLADERRGK